VIALPTIWAATEDMDFVWYFSDVVLSASFAQARTLPTRRRGAAREVMPSSGLPPTPTSPTAGWVIRRPFVAMALVALSRL
jgi:hypothetical protein